MGRSLEQVVHCRIQLDYRWDSPLSLDGYYENIPPVATARNFVDIPEQQLVEAVLIDAINLIQKGIVSIISKGKICSGDGYTVSDVRHAYTWLIENAFDPASLTSLYCCDILGLDKDYICECLFGRKYKIVRLARK